MDSLNLHNYWRKLSFITNNLVLSGDLERPGSESTEKQLEHWVNSGITCIIDVRCEGNDKQYVTARYPHIEYHHVGTHDNGSKQPREWFDSGVKISEEVLNGADNQKILVHCHMGVNRAPSMMYAMLLNQRIDCVKALDMIRSKRPIARILYASDALEWWAERTSIDTDQHLRQQVAALQWFKDNLVYEQ